MKMILSHAANVTDMMLVLILDVQSNQVLVISSGAMAAFELKCLHETKL